MSDPLPIANGVNGTTGRDTLGRFTPGNRAAVGRSQPFATQAAALRRAFYEAVTPADLQAPARHLITQAKGGNLAATKLLWHCQLNRTPLYSLRPAWHTCAMKAAPRVRSARFSSNGISLWSCYEPLHIDQPLQTSSVSG
jgi:hypothetical protein